MSTQNKKERKTENEGKPCRACMDFKSWITLQRNHPKPNNNLKENNQGLEASGAFQKFNISSEDDYIRRAKIKINGNIGNSQVTHKVEVQDGVHVLSWGLGLKFGCPADILSLGRGTWRLLHTMAAYYPEYPSKIVENDMNNFLLLFAKFFPCKPCAEDFQEWIKINPPKVNSRSSLSKWLCTAHNDVNIKLGKPVFDCSLVDERWSEGWKDGSCD